jgi:hypothetical protein
LWDHWYSEMRLLVRDQPASAGAQMFRRTAILFEIVSDRKCWWRLRLKSVGNFRVRTWPGAKRYA